MYIYPGTVMVMFGLLCIFVFYWIDFSVEQQQSANSQPNTPIKEYGTKGVVNDLVLFDMVDD